MIRIAENFARNDTELPYTNLYDNLYSTTISDDLLAAATVGDTVYISVLVDARESIPKFRMYDSNGSKSLAIGAHLLRDIPQGLAWYTVQSTLTMGQNSTVWTMNIWDMIDGVGNGKDWDLLKVIVSLSPSDIWTPAHADLTPEQIATLPPYGEYKEIKAF